MPSLVQDVQCQKKEVPRSLLVLQNLPDLLEGGERRLYPQGLKERETGRGKYLRDPKSHL